MKVSIVVASLLFLFLVLTDYSLIVQADVSDSDDEDSEHDVKEVVNDVEEPNHHDTDNDLPKRSTLWEEEDEIDSNKDGIYETNPDYVEPSIDSVLRKEKTVVQKSIRQIASFVKKHKFETLALCLGLFLVICLASLQSIQAFILLYIFKARRNEKGDLEIELNLLNILHFCVLLAILYHVIKTRHNEDDSGEESLLTAMLVGPQHAAATMLLRRLIRPVETLYNTAFIPPIQQHYTFETLNDRYLKDIMAIAKASKKSIMPVSNITANATETNATIVVLDWTGLDSSVSSLDTLKDCVSYLLSMSKNDNNTLDIVVTLESPGGSASRYALAAQQLCRLRESHHVTVCVDTVAASGGYMIACTASRIVAAPLAVLGSIGVVGSSVNVHRMLENWGVTNLVFRGGRDKAPLGLIGKVTEDNVAQVQDWVDDAHRAFKRFVVENRPILAENIEDIATGNIWLGYDALDNGLIDEIGTSDEYLLARMKEGVRVLKLQQIKRTGPFGTISTSASAENSFQPSLRRRFGLFLAKALVGSDTSRHITSILAKVNDRLPVRTTQFPG